jgi:two-component system, NarL family, captular synthesis response regulator RcsB
MRVVISDAHPIVMFGLRELLQGREGYDVVLARHPCELCITDCFMSAVSDSTNGLTLFDEIRERHPSLRVVVHTLWDNHALHRHMLMKGASAVVEKTSRVEEMIRALQAARTGRTYISERLRSDGVKSAERADGRTSETRTLSARESEVIHMLTLGLTVTDIARQMSRSVKTISQHKHVAMRKLGIDTNSHLFEYLLTVRR